MTGYAVRNDGQGWRSVEGAESLMADEWYTESTPPEPVSLPPTVEELGLLVKEKRDRLLAVASNRMGPFQDAVDLGEASVDDVTSLKAWKQYRVALNRIDQQPTFPIDIAWPVSPE
ncbi:tail fiber assembly protein [Pseudomonas gingeri]|uniref:tail fiber assembly protein n=1 Tax=Pseudomonas gingeri TaxID=117681 RepID=UPI0015A40379|nr:tail fiber assembly protein [Pseudomonas gingeri]NWD08046.1 tail fiber assembly protein [Pseudomonas gingeri]NWE34619.1 tail fiber assembly protein [Pseudomonas gingeri]NWE59378.1 tail fiber assembly protein [Pseudomonas gingeri]NWF01353.1 tail fiber assembly protein [Pseudomonas gingeri]